MGFIVKKGISNIYVLFSIIILISVFVSIFVIANNSDNQAKNDLAQVVNGQSIDSLEVQKYLKANSYFKDLNFETINRGQNKEVLLKVRNRNDNIKGIMIEDKKYVIDLIFCDYNFQRCNFKINGINAVDLHSSQANASISTSFDIDDITSIMVNSINWDYCDNRRFCDLYYESYDIVNITVISK